MHIMPMDTLVVLIWLVLLLRELIMQTLFVLMKAVVHFDLVDGQSDG